MQMSLSSNDWREIHSVVDQMERNVAVLAEQAQLTAITCELIRDTDKSGVECAKEAKTVLKELQKGV